MMLIVGLAVALEEFIEHLRSQFSWFRGEIIHATKYAAGVALAFGFDLRLFAESGLSPNGAVDHVVTGLMLGAGSSLVNGIINKLVGSNRWSA